MHVYCCIIILNAVLMDKSQKEDTVVGVKKWLRDKMKERTDVK